MEDKKRPIRKVKDLVQAKKKGEITQDEYSEGLCELMEDEDNKQIVKCAVKVEPDAPAQLLTEF
ncbi:MAG: hypothetical protein IKC37_05070 [Clostridia bacterium]|nr:hypothetical protein [Clostridia bacterium]